MSVSLADYLWAHMGGLYGHKWASAFGTNPKGIGGSEWALTLQDLTRAQLDAGLDACRRSGEEWPPSAPAFRARCFGIPSLEQVRADLHKRTMPFTLLVWQSLDYSLLTQSSQRDGDRMLQQAYSYAAARVLDGAELPQLPAGAIEQEKRPFKPASAAAREAARALVDRAMGRHTQESGATEHEPVKGEDPKADFGHAPPD